MENHQLAGKWARHFARYSIINSRIGVNPFFGPNEFFPLRTWVQAGAFQPVPRHSRLDNAGPEGDYSILDERAFLQAIPETAVSNCLDRPKFEGAG